VDDVRWEIGDRLDAFDPRLTQPKSDLELSLTIAARDVWVAVLSAMAGVTGTGYPVVRLDAQRVGSTDRATAADEVGNAPRADGETAGEPAPRQCRPGVSPLRS
jgi:hypothetical protein